MLKINLGEARREVKMGKGKSQGNVKMVCSAPFRKWVFSCYFKYSLLEDLQMGAILCQEWRFLISYPI